MPEWTMYNRMDQKPVVLSEADRELYRKHMIEVNKNE